MSSRFFGDRPGTTGGEDPFQRLQREIGRLVDDAIRGFPPGLRQGPAGSGFTPCLALRETPEGLELTAELPGVEEGDIDLSIEGEMLTLRGEKREERGPEERAAHVQERSYGRFQRSLRLPFAPDRATAAARLDKGVLRVILPRPATADGRKDNRIPIRGGAPG